MLRSAAHRSRGFPNTGRGRPRPARACAAYTERAQRLSLRSPSVRTLSPGPAATYAGLSFPVYPRRSSPHGDEAFGPAAQPTLALLALSQQGAPHGKTSGTHGRLARPSSVLNRVQGCVRVPYGLDAPSPAYGRHPSTVGHSERHGVPRSSRSAQDLTGSQVNPSSVNRSTKGDTTVPNGSRRPPATAPRRDTREVRTATEILRLSSKPLGHALQGCSNARISAHPAWS